MNLKFWNLGLLGLVWLALVAASETKPATPQKQQVALADSAAQKLAHIQRNGMQQKPDQTPVVLTEAELNAYFAEGRVKLPKGVKSVHFKSEPGIVTANTEINFDEVRAGQESSNPLLAIFSGVHDVQVVAHGAGSGGLARVQVESVSLDGMKVPRFALEMFVEKFIRPK